MLPRSVADDLKTGREVRTETFDNVSIVYLDIVGFVAMISKLTPIQVVELLNALYGSVFTSYLMPAVCGPQRHHMEFSFPVQSQSLRIF